MSAPPPFILSAPAWQYIAFVTKTVSILCVPLLLTSLFILTAKKRSAELQTNFHGYLIVNQICSLAYFIYAICFTDFPSFGVGIDFYKSYNYIFGHLFLIASGVLRTRAFIEVLIAFDRCSAVIYPLTYGKSIWRHTKYWSLFVFIAMMSWNLPLAIIIEYTTYSYINGLNLTAVSPQAVASYALPNYWVQRITLFSSFGTLGSVVVLYFFLLGFIMISKKYKDNSRITKVAIKLTIVGFVCSFGELFVAIVIGLNSMAWQLFSLNLIPVSIYWNLNQIGRDISLIFYTIVPLIAFSGVRRRMMEMWLAGYRKNQIFVSFSDPLATSQT